MKNNIINFKNLHALFPDQFTTEIFSNGRYFDLHNEWRLTEFVWDFENKEVRINWKKGEIKWDLLPSSAVHSLDQFSLVFDGVSQVEISHEDNTSGDNDFLSNIIYQSLPEILPFVRFWFGDGKNISITSQGLSLLESDA